jgi:general stress protein CsbA
MQKSKRKKWPGKWQSAIVAVVLTTALLYAGGKVGWTFIAIADVFVLVIGSYMYDHAC